MKNFLLGFLVVFSLISPVTAQNFEFETIRTEESPGFFGIRIYPPENAFPMDVRDIFVKNFSAREAQIYEDLILVLGEFGAKIIETKEVVDFENNSNYRLIFLGKEKTGKLNFQSNDEKTILEDFEQFAMENLGIIFFQDVKFDFGGNISEVYPEKINFWGTDPVLLTGKFEKPMRTLTQVSGVSKEGEIVATSMIDLREFVYDPMARDLPEIWEEMSAPTKNSKPLNPLWLSIFPWILGGVGGLLIFSMLTKAFVRNRRKNEAQEASVVQNMSESDFKDLEDNLPFEVERKENKL